MPFQKISDDVDASPFARKRRAHVQVARESSGDKIVVNVLDFVYVMRCDMLFCFFDLPTTDAARLLRVSVSLLKRIKWLCGILKWPYVDVQAGVYRLSAEQIRNGRTAAVQMLLDQRVCGPELAFLRILMEVQHFAGDFEVQAGIAGSWGFGRVPVKPVVRGERKSVKVAVQRIGGSSAKSVKKSTGSSVEKSTDSSVEKSTDSSVEKSTDSSVEKSTGSSVEKSTDLSVEKSTDLSVEKSTGSSVEKSVDKSTDVPVENSTALSSVAPDHFLVPWDCPNERWLGGADACEPPADEGSAPFSYDFLLPPLHDPARIHMLELLSHVLPPSRLGPPEAIPCPPVAAPAGAWEVVDGFWTV